MDYDEALDDFHNGEDVSAAGESAGSIRRRDDVEAEEARSFLSRSPSREPVQKRARADEPPRAGPSNAPARAPTSTGPRAGRGGDFGRGGCRGGRPRGRGGARNFRLGPFGAPNEPFSPFRPANWTGGTDGWATTTHGPGVFPPGHEPTFTPLQEDDDESDLGSGEPDSDSERIRDRRQLRRKRALELRAEPLHPVAVAIRDPAALQYVRERQVMLMMDITRVPKVISRNGALTAATAPLGRTRRVDRTPTQLIIQKFNALPRTVADPRHDRPLTPTRDAPLGVWITTLATNVNALPRGIRTMRWGTHNADPHFLAVSQVRTWCTLQRMLPDDTTDFQYRWLTEAILLIGELATTGPGNGRVGYIAWCESFGVELRLNRALSRFTPNHGPLDMPHFVKFLASECGINPIEFNDMLPFVAEACYVNLQLVDEVDRSQAVLDSIASHVLQDGGRWPQGLPGPSYWATSSQDPKWFYAAPPLPGSDQVLLGHRSPPTCIDAIADPNFIYAPNDPEQYRMRKLPVIAVERWVMANVPPAAHPTASGDTVERDEEMGDASKETPSQPEAVAATPIDNPSALSAEGSAQPESGVDADVPKDDLAQPLPPQGEGAGSGAVDA